MRTGALVFGIVLMVVGYLLMQPYLSLVSNPPAHQRIYGLAEAFPFLLGLVFLFVGLGIAGYGAFKSRQDEKR